ncbi:hypothetical protein L1281_001330 [Neisseria sp. HSC-16F19]|nr:hypothetical protein [Neisseria sp. HSC-16F19]MCP2040741.1 hypothetical protein [Neisseria sp. HSC-16F19]
MRSKPATAAAFLLPSFLWRRKEYIHVTAGNPRGTAMKRKSKNVGQLEYKVTPALCFQAALSMKHRFLILKQTPNTPVKAA